MRFTKRQKGLLSLAIGSHIGNLRNEFKEIPKENHFIMNNEIKEFEEILKILKVE